MTQHIAALFVESDGPYSNLPGIDCWDKTRDARTYAGPHPVIAHPPCERWGRYARGGPSAKAPRLLGNDQGCFATALWAVRTFGGVLEHPEASHAWNHFSLWYPDWNGGWAGPDRFGAMVCCVAQGRYGHAARKMTWLYAKLPWYPELEWGPCSGHIRMDLGFHSAEERRRAIRAGANSRLSKRQRLLTPLPFRDLLINMVRGVK